MNLKCRTGFNSNTKDKPKVYFTCHPDDFQFCFFKICDDLLRIRDCAIYYTEDMSLDIPEEDKELDILSNNLFVIPVTRKLLTTANRAMDSDYTYAVKAGMRILPIMMEAGIDSLYSASDKFGELQYLKAYNYDATEISYEEKLKKFLESVFLGEELKNRIRAEFDAYIFLSYRKKDRHYANELMRLIHNNSECRDIAIWFDEFLTPGESFKENIQSVLDSCQLFALLVTPHLLEKVVDENGQYIDNYVISTELPLARKNKAEKGVDIFAVEMEPTDREALAAMEIVDYINSNDQSFRTRLLDVVSRIVNSSNNTPVHNYLIGLAYLEGVDVEINRHRGMELILDAANSDCMEAIIKMADMCNDKDEKVEWFRKAVLVGEKEFRATRNYQTLTMMFDILFQLFDIQMHHKVWEGKDLFLRMVEFDAYMLENKLYQTPDDAKKLCAACANLFRHRAKHIVLIGDEAESKADFEDWLTAYEKLSMRDQNFAKGELALAYQHYIEFLEKENKTEISLGIANKLTQLALKEAVRYKVRLDEDYSERFYFDVPDEVRTYTFWLELLFLGYLHIAKSCEKNRKYKLLCLRRMLELLEYLRRHAVTYSFCGDIANLYRMLGRLLEDEGKVTLSQKAYANVNLIEEGMPMRKKIIPKFDAELNATVDKMIQESV